MKKLLLLCFGIVLTAGITCYAVKKAIHNPVHLTSEVIIDFPSGGNIRTLSAKLADMNIVKWKILPRIAAKIYGFDKSLKAGEYQLEPGISLFGILEKISRGQVVLHRLTLPEGLTTFQMLKIIEQNELLSGKITSSVKEGDLLPETYTFHKGDSRNKLIETAKAAMLRALSEAWEGRIEGLPLASSDELLVLASIIEKETAVGVERGKIASVFINRLNAGMMLQTDPTVIYAITQGRDDLGRSLKRQDLTIDSPYNTYKYSGLPPLPICNPGLKALQAAANPENTPYYYFVADGKGGHNFAENLNKHNQNVRAWVKQIRAQ